MGSKSVQPSLLLKMCIDSVLVRYIVDRFKQSYTLVPMYFGRSFCWVGQHFSFMGVN